MKKTIKKSLSRRKNNAADWSELVHLISGKFDDVDGRFDELKRLFRDLQSSVDAYAKRADVYFQEMVMLSRKIDRHEKWIKAAC